jgi:formylglycine-generating enzyme required for sulfatase activity
VTSLTDRIAHLVLLAGAAGGCGGGTAVPSDAPADSVPADATELPTVEPRGPRCEGVIVQAGERCLQEGWFLFSRWTTVEYYGPDEADVPTVPTRPVYLDTFLVDQHEVTVDEYAEFVARTGATPPPDLCGYDDYTLPVSFDHGRAPEVSGWQGGVPEAGRGDHPVVCVTRGEARAFCEDRGGRLPTVFEWARTVRDTYPDARRFPWGNTPPPEGPAPWPDLIGAWHLDYATMAQYVPGLGTLPVGSASEGASAAGILDLAGSVGELLGTCAEEVASIPESTDPLVRPDGGGRAERCSEGVVVAGSSWRSFADPQHAFASTVYIMGDGPNSFRYPDPTHGSNNSTTRFHMWGDPQPIAPVPETAGNDRRSWQIGWRCAYDAPSR